ncbi:MAG: cardiolipin synthase [Thermodesulfobacteriota bacterium]
MGLPENYEIVIAVVIGLIELIGILSAIDAVMKDRTAQGAIAWAISLITFPYVSVPLYWIFGRSKFHGYVKLRSSRDLEIRVVIEKLRQAFHDREIIDDIRNSDEQVLAQLADMPMTCGNSARLLINGEATFDQIFERIAAAWKYILVQFYIVNDDNLGRRFQEALMKKAAAGVQVYFLYDEIGCHKLPGKYIDDLRESGVRVSPFLTTKGKANRFQINFRNHRKIVVVDGHAAFVGGHNVGDEYLGLDPHYGFWRDTHVCIQGPAVQGIQCCFLEDWYWATGMVVPELVWEPATSAGGNMRALVFATGPADKLDTCGLMFIHAFNSARRRVWIASPYFVPDPPVINALQLAAMRGVEVRILLPQKPDHRLVYWASFSYYEKTIPLGIKIYRYRKGFLHQKVFLVDDHLAAVGTANFDNRSFRLNFEITMLFHDAIFAREVERMLEDDFSASRREAMVDLEKRPFWFRFLVRSARLLAPIL